MGEGTMNSSGSVGGSSLFPKGDAAPHSKDEEDGSAACQLDTNGLVDHCKRTLESQSEEQLHRMGEIGGHDTYVSAGKFSQQASIGRH